MKELRACLQSFARATRLPPAVGARLRDRLGERADAEVRSVLQFAPGPTSTGLARVRTRLAGVGVTRPTVRRRLVAAGVLAAGAAMVLSRHTPGPAPAPEPSVQAASPLSVQIDSGEQWTSARPAPGVNLEMRGAGTVTGTELRPHLEWDVGTLKVAVEPGRGVDLTVHTAEADVRVVGTAFTVTRDAFGTTVAVEHGRVSVSCERQGDAALGAGELRTCLPGTAAGMLARAHAIEDRGAPSEDVLNALDRGLALGPSTAVEGELRFARIGALAALGRRREALVEAQGYLARADAPRRDEVRRLAAALEREPGGSP